MLLLYIIYNIIFFVYSTTIIDIGEALRLSVLVIGVIIAINHKSVAVVKLWETAIRIDTPKL